MDNLQKSQSNLSLGPDSIAISQNQPAYLRLHNKSSAAYTKTYLATA